MHALGEVDDCIQERMKLRCLTEFGGQLPIKQIARRGPWPKHRLGPSGEPCGIAGCGGAFERVPDALFDVPTDDERHRPSGQQGWQLRSCTRSLARTAARRTSDQIRDELHEHGSAQLACSNAFAIQPLRKLDRAADDVRSVHHPRAGQAKHFDVMCNQHGDRTDPPAHYGRGSTRLREKDVQPRLRLFAVAPGRGTVDGMPAINDRLQSRFRVDQIFCVRVATPGAPEWVTARPIGRLGSP